MIELRSLHSRGMGLTDTDLIASCPIDPTTLLGTNDKRLWHEPNLWHCRRLC
jgi:hypothetical protein